MIFFKKKPESFYYAGIEIRQDSRDKYKCLDAATRGVLDKARFRINWVMIGFGVCFFMILARLFYLTIVDYQSRMYNPTVLQTDIDYTRYNIIDRNGMILATSVPTKDLSVNPKKVPVKDRISVAKNLAAVLPDVEYDDIFAKLNSNTSFQYIKRNLTPKERQDVNWLGYYFLSETNGEKRVYPQGRLFSHLLGSVDIDNKGTAGLEKAFEQHLLTQDLQVSLDLSIQEVVRNTLSQEIEKFGAVGGIGLVMKVDSGEVLASVSLPDYNPNLSLKDEAPNRFNKASLGIYEFGSVFKLFNTAMGLEYGVINPYSTVDAKHTIKIGRKVLEDYQGQKRTLMIPEVLMHSSNLGSVNIAFKVEPKQQQDFLNRFMLYQPLDIELLEKGTPQFPTRSTWADITRANVAFGYGISVSALHVIAGVAGLINDGYYNIPTFIKNGNANAPQYQVVSEKTSEIMRHLMWGVINWNAKEGDAILQYHIGGKTGSANVIEDGKYVQGSLRTTFVGAFPMNNPQYVVMIVMEKPKKLKENWYFNTAGWNAKPTAIKIITQIAPYLGIGAQMPWAQPGYMTQSIEKSKLAKKQRDAERKRRNQ